MTLRKLFLLVHLWVGLGAGLVLSVVGITGSLYVLEPEGNGWLHGGGTAEQTPGYAAARR